MKKAVSVILIVFIILLFYSAFSSYAAEPRDYADTNTTNALKKASDNSKEKIDSYITKYGSQSYGMTAYVLDQIRWFSIPVCILGVAVRSNSPICYWYKKVRHET